MISKAKFALMGGLICVLAGCGSSDPPIGTVKGTVTVDGEPRAELQVSFQPTSGGIGSSAITDASGKYELTYDGGRKQGAAIGSHLVQITSGTGGGEAGGEAAIAPIKIPARYNAESTITKEVAAGENTVDLEVITK